MYIGVLTVPFGDESLDNALNYLSGIGIGGVELVVGDWPGEDHANQGAVLANDDTQANLLGPVENRGLQINTLVTHNNPLHPIEETAAEINTELRGAIEPTDALDVNTATCSSGLPVDGPNDEAPDWITVPWSTEHADVHDYQWEVTVDYQLDLAAFADSHGADIAIEMHPSMLVHEPTGTLKLHEAANERTDTSFDPSHLYWQGISIIDAIRFLGEKDTIHHFHVKDTRVYKSESRTKGVLDTTSYAGTVDHSWLSRSIDCSHDEGHWKDVVSTLRIVGYEGTFSIEHEDMLTSSTEGFEEIVDVLSHAVLKTQLGDAYWTE